jgi:DNA-binding protein YbaB
VTASGHDFPENERLRAYSEELQGQVQKVIEQGADVQRQIAAVQATAKSDDGLVEITVDARGQLVNLRLDPAIYRRPNTRELAESITETMHAAVADATKKAHDIAATVVPRESLEVHASGNVEAIVDSMTNRIFGRD